MTKPPSSHSCETDEVPAVQTDVLGSETALQPPSVPAPAGGSAVPESKTPEKKEQPDRPTPTEDENQPGFIGKRNLPHP